MWEPSAWQKDPNNLKTDTGKVQFWKNGVMLGLLNLEEARRLVAEGKAFISTSQAINTLGEVK